MTLSASTKAETQTLPAYRRIAEAFGAEGVEACFALLGDGNMNVCAALAERPEMRMIYARHEQCAVAMAMGYARASGRLGVASVTCGPGITQISTALTVAARARIPLVVFAGETPAEAPFHAQSIDQGAYVRASGARYISAASPARLLSDLQDAFLTAMRDRCPVVIGVPYDLQKRPLPSGASYSPSAGLLPEVGRMHPDPTFVGRAAEMVRNADRIIVLGGRGVLSSEAINACIRLADACGALMATTLPARGLFDASPYSIGIVGGFSSRLAREKFAEADLVILVGASLASHASMGGRMFNQAKVIQIDTEPLGKNQGGRVADLYVRADARAGAEVLESSVVAARPAADWRSDDVVRRAVEEAPDGEPATPADGLDPRAVAAELERSIPLDWELVSGAGHSSFFYSNLRGRGPGKFHAIREFGVIGDGISYAIGVATARAGAKIVLTEGDGSLMMHAQELETIRRHGLNILICVFNDGGYGSELHKMRHEGLAEDGAFFGRGDMAAIARGFGIEGETVTSISDLVAGIGRFQASGKALLLDIHISDEILSPNMRQLTGRPGG
ncbi:thiamine pyrophosphate-binding protein [Mesorhizobium sp. CAU 1741]|uniref:thiamine pyrophosphate-binding protein n=1 Tax=Mesorhizobium sp. CAU 1741 TaxID=3140366 RepID=UPI00325B5C3D